MRGARYVLFGLWAVAFVLGLVGVWQRVAFGHVLAGYGSYVVWGLWVAAYVYFVGLSAGSFLFAAVVNVFDLKPLKRLTPVALLTALVSIGVAVLAVLFDLGHMTRAFKVFTSPNFSSMMTWMIWMYTAYAVVLLAIGWYTYKGDRPMLTALYALGIPLAIAFPGGGGALFATLSARTYWHSPMFPIFFVVGALLSGVALLSLLAAIIWPRRGEMLRLLGRVVLTLIAVDLLLEWAEFSIPLWYGVNPERELLLQILAGPYWWVFWVVHILLGSVIPIVLLVRRPSAPWAVGTAGALAAATFMAVRLNIVIPGQVTPELKGLQQAFTDARLTFQYAPTTHEWLVFLFLVAVGVAALWLGFRYLPLIDRKEVQPDERVA